ncbi:MAG: hypothetical protein ACI4AK_05775 [Lepagella sp.]
MQKKEFEELTGLKCSDAQYSTIEKIYLHSEMTKNEFCEDYANGCGHKIQEELLDEIEALERCITSRDLDISNLRQERAEIVDFLLSRYNATGDDELRQQVIAMVGEKGYILRRLYMAHQIIEERDRNIIIELLEA